MVNFVVTINLINHWRTSVNDTKKLVEKALEKIRPMLQRDGGDIELVEVNDGVVKVRLTGACKGCPMSQMTLKQGVEKLLLKEVPGLKEVQAV
jgi:Fe-S cluster biogenesis protein NfuA